MVHSVALIAAQYWVLPLHTISMLLFTVQVMNCLLSTYFGDSYISYGGTWDNPFQWLCQGSGGGKGLWLRVRTYIIKLIQQRRHSIILNNSIYATNEQLRSSSICKKKRTYQYKVNPNRKSKKPSGSSTHLGRRIKGDGRHTATWKVLLENGVFWLVWSSIDIQERSHSTLNIGT